MAGILQNLHIHVDSSQDLNLLGSWMIHASILLGQTS